MQMSQNYPRYEKWMRQVGSRVEQSQLKRGEGGVGVQLEATEIGFCDVYH